MIKLAPFVDPVMTLMFPPIWKAVILGLHWPSRQYPSALRAGQEGSSASS